MQYNCRTISRSKPAQGGVTRHWHSSTGSSWLTGMLRLKNILYTDSITSLWHHFLPTPCLAMSECVRCLRGVWCRSKKNTGVLDTCFWLCSSHPQQNKWWRDINVQTCQWSANYAWMQEQWKKRKREDEPFQSISNVLIPLSSATMHLTSLYCV